MPTLDEIVKQIENIDGVQPIKKQHLHKRKDLNELTEVLRDDEKIEKFSGAFYNNRPSSIVATDQRFLIIQMTAFSSVKVEEFTYDGINSVEYNRGLTSSGLQLFLKDRLIDIGGINNNLVQGIFDYTRSKISSPKKRELEVEERSDSIVSPTLEEIISQIKKLDRTKHILKLKEIKELPGILRHNEKIEKIALGEYGESYGIIVATDQRFLYISKGMFSGAKVKDYPYDRIDSLNLHKNKIYFPGWPGAELDIISQGNLAAVITKVQRPVAQEIFDYIQSKISSSEER